jgi:lysine 2,3-aminomutase
VFIAAASRRGHANKLRQALNQIGVLTYYNFSVKGYHENTFNFATNERAVQEQLEEKFIGKIKKKEEEKLIKLLENTVNITDDINNLREEIGIPFLSTDRNVLNLPGVGKSLSYRTIGITRYGRRILKFEHDKNRNHSPIVNKMDNVIIIESKSIAEYLNQLDSFGEDIKDYESIWGYSISETEKRSPIFEYPEYNYSVTKQITNLEI